MCAYNAEKRIRQFSLPAFINVIALILIIFIHYQLCSANLLYLRLHFSKSLAIILIVREILYPFIYPERVTGNFVNEK